MVSWIYIRASAVELATSLVDVEERDQALLREPGMREGEILVTVRDRRDDSR